MSKLKKMIDDVNTDEKVKARYHKDRDRLMKEYGLSDDEIDLLKQEKHDEIEEKVGTRISDVFI